MAHMMAGDTWMLRDMRLVFLLRILHILRLRFFFAVNSILKQLADHVERSMIMALTRTRTAAVEPATSALEIADAIKAVKRADAPESLHRVVVDGAEVAVSGNVFDAVLDVLSRFASQDAVVVGSSDSLLTTSRAAELAGVSRPFLCQVIDNGELAAEYVGTHRKIRLDALNAYLAKRRQGRRAALDDVARIAREAGQYEDDF